MLGGSNPALILACKFGNSALLLTTQAYCCGLVSITLVMRIELLSPISYPTVIG